MGAGHPRLWSVRAAARRQGTPLPRAKPRAEGSGRGPPRPRPLVRRRVRRADAAADPPRAALVVPGHAADRPRSWWRCRPAQRRARRSPCASLVWLAVAVVAWRVGGERGEAVLDLLMHPRARRLMRAETDVVLALPRLAWTALVAGRPRRGLRYSRGDAGPVDRARDRAHGVGRGRDRPPAPARRLARRARRGRRAPRLHARVAAGLGARLARLPAPHRPRRARVRATARCTESPSRSTRCRAAVPRRERAGSSGRARRVLVIRDGAALLPSRGRVDLWLELDRPVLVRRPLGEPVAVTRLAVASDDADDARAARLRAGAAAAAPRPAGGRVVAALTGGELAGGLRDALQPA